MAKTTDLQTKNMDKRSVLFPKIELKKFVLQPHSHLHHLPPIGVGTPCVESLTSYISRLAKAHCVNVGSLYSHELEPKLKYLDSSKNPTKSPQAKLITNFYQYIYAVNGLSKTATNWNALLENLTLRLELKYLTMLPWQNVLSRNNLQKHTRAWCSYCFAESHEREDIVYEQLLWTIRNVNFCVKHKTLLITKCPHCAKQCHVLTYKSNPGHCFHCNNWLGTKVPAEVREASEESPEIQDEIQNSNIISSLIDLSDKYPGINKKQSFTKNLRYSIDWIANGNVSAFGKALKINPLIVANLYKGNICLEIEILISLYKFLGVSVETLFCGNVTGDQLFKIDIPVSLTREDKVKHLKDSLQSSASPTVRELAEQLGYKSKISLYDASPELCKQITEKHNLFNGNKKSPPTIVDSTTIINALKSALKENPIPSLDAIAKGLGYPTYDSIRDRFPELTDQIINQRNQDYNKKLKETEKILKNTLREETPQSLSSVARSLGCSTASLRRNFPDLCKKIAKRFLQHKPVYQTILKALENALTEFPPPSVNSIATSLKLPNTRLYVTNSDLCYKIAAAHSAYIKKMNS